jgi:hypothetical protein
MAWMLVLTINPALRTHEGIGTGATGATEMTAALSSQDPVIELFIKRQGRGAFAPLVEQATELDALEDASSLIDRVDF